MRIIIKKLFGIFNYDITLCENGMSIITGPNGFGKSTIIKCIKAISESNLVFFYELTFESIILFDEVPDNKIEIVKNDRGLDVNGVFIDEKTILYAKSYSYRRRRDAEVDRNNLEKYQDAMENMKNFIGKVEYIEEQRLIAIDEERISPYTEHSRMSSDVNRKMCQVVETVPQKLVNHIRRASMMYSRVAGELDSTFPIRLFHEKDGIQQQEFDLKIQQMKAKTEKLDEYGFYATRPMGEIQFQEKDARALKVYFEDFEKKYEQYERLLEKLDLYKRMINARFQFKHVAISADEGLKVINDNGKNVDLKNLSSGEKETIVLFYRLLFDVEDGALLLIDEPEISLHIAWQRMFVEDLQTIVKIKGLSAIVATHSAQIVNGNFDIQVDLGEYYQKWIQSEKM